MHHSQIDHLGQIWRARSKITWLLRCINQLHNANMICGYVGVSTDVKTVGAQVEALTAAGVVKVFRETASTAKTDRAQLCRLLDVGDVLIVNRLDRLARSMRDLLNILANIAGQKAGFQSLSNAWADTTTIHGQLMFAVLSGLHKLERDLIRARTGEGRASAVRGVKMGCKPKLTPDQRWEALRRKESGEAIREIARSCNVHNSTISRLRT